MFVWSLPPKCGFTVRLMLTILRSLNKYVSLSFKQNQSVLIIETNFIYVQLTATKKVFATEQFQLKAVPKSQIEKQLYVQTRLHVLHNYLNTVCAISICFLIKLQINC